MSVSLRAGVQAVADALEAHAKAYAVGYLHLLEDIFEECRWNGSTKDFIGGKGKICMLLST